MRWRKLGLESHVALERTRFFRKLFTRTSTQIAWIFMTCLEQMLRNADHWDVTLNISKKINYLNGWISNQEFVLQIDSVLSILLGFIHWHPSRLCHLRTCFALITFLILFCFYYHWAILSDTTPRAKHRFNVYLISCINRGYYMAARGYEFYLRVLKVRDTFSTRR